MTELIIIFVIIAAVTIATIGIILLHRQRKKEKALREKMQKMQAEYARKMYEETVKNEDGYTDTYINDKGIECGMYAVPIISSKKYIISYEVGIKDINGRINLNGEATEFSYNLNKTEAVIKMLSDDTRPYLVTETIYTFNGEKFLHKNRTVIYINMDKTSMSYSQKGMKQNG